MKNVFIGIAIGAGVLLAPSVSANQEIPVRYLGIIAGFEVVKFVDPDNGNVCYMNRDSNKGGITCLKP